MNRRGRIEIKVHKDTEEVIEPGSTKAALDEVDNGGGPAGSPPGDRHAADQATDGTGQVGSSPRRTRKS